MIANSFDRVVNVCLIGVLVLWGGAVYANDALPRTEAYQQLSRISNGLSVAIRNGDLTKLKRDESGEKRLIRWDVCRTGMVLHLDFDQIVHKLNSLERKGTIAVNKQVLDLLSVTTVETTGWGGPYPYLLFNFARSGTTWRLDSVWQCGEGEVPSTQSSTAPDLVGVIEKAITTRNFQLLRAFAPSKPGYFWNYCEPTDTPDEELTFSQIQDRLIKDSKGTTIHVKPEVDIYDFPAERTLRGAAHTRGWRGEYRYVTFFFRWSNAQKAWRWIGACYSIKPPTRIGKDGHYEQVRFE